MFFQLKCPDFPSKMSGILDPKIPPFRTSALFSSAVFAAVVAVEVAEEGVEVAAMIVMVAVILDLEGMMMAVDGLAAEETLEGVDGLVVEVEVVILVGVVEVGMIEH